MVERGFEALVENAPDGIVVSRDGIILYANAAAARLLGHDDVSELVGKPMRFLDLRSVEVMRRRIEQMAATGERLVPREYPATRRDGSVITAEIASTIIDFEGAPAVLAYARDVTERVRLHAQLAHTDRLAALGRMGAGVAHEINNPLALIRLASETLSERGSPEDRALAAEVRAAVDRIAAIVRDLRSFGRGDDESPGAVDLAAVIDAAEQLVSHEIRPRGRLLKEYGELPRVVGVAHHVEQVLVNVLLNAAQALEDGPDGRIVVRASVTEDRVVLSIEDNGRGIPADQLAAMFEPFVTTRAGSGGTGLGLSICRDLVVRCGGELTARSKPGEGTTMELRLSRVASQLSPAPRSSVVPDLAPAPREVARSVLRKNVLVVDDEELIVRSLTRILADHATVVGETVAERALALILSDASFDVIICDVMMDGMSGVELHERVARERPDVAARFVFITGGAYTAHAQSYLERVPNKQLEKPFVVADLVAEIDRVSARETPASSSA